MFLPSRRSAWLAMAKSLDFYWDYFLTSFCYRVPLPLVFLLILGMLSGAVGGDYGVPNLMWHDDRVKQGVVGFCFALLVALCLLTGYLLDQDFRRARSNRAPISFSRYTAGVLACFLGTVTLVFVAGEVYEGIIALVGHKGSSVDTGGDLRPGLGNPQRRWPLLFGAALGGALAALLAVGPLAWLASHLNTGLYKVLGPDVRRKINVEYSSARRSLSRPRWFHMYIFGLAALILLGHTAACWVASHFDSWLLGALVEISWLGVVAGYSYWGRRQAFALVDVLVRRMEPYIHSSLRLGQGADSTLDDRKVGQEHFHSVTILYMVLSLVLIYMLSSFELTRSPGVAAAFLLFVVIAVYGVVKYVLRQAIPVFLVALGGLAIYGGLDKYKYRFDDLKEYYDGGSLANTTDLNKLVGDENLPKADPSKARVVPPVKLNSDPIEKDPKVPGLLNITEIPPPRPGVESPLIVMAVSGGGLRSAAWTFRVLAELELRCAEKGFDFAKHVRVVAGASGGMLGAAYYVHTLPTLAQRQEIINDRTGGKLKSRRDKLLKEHLEVLSGDFLTPVVNQLVYNDLPSLFSPFPVKTDRGERLQHEWAEKLFDGGRGPTFGALYEKESKGEVPSLVFSPMLVEDGRRLLVTNLDLRYVVTNSGGSVPDGGDDGLSGKPGVYSYEALELFRLFPEARADFRVATAIRMSASFPFFSPAVSLPTRPRRRVVDAGYYDNYGVSLLCSYLSSGKHEPWITKNASKVLLVQIRDSLGDEARQLKQVRPADLSNQRTRAVEDFLTPLEGLDNGRVASASFRNDGQVEQLSLYFDQKAKQKSYWSSIIFGVPRVFATAIFEFGGHASLSWYLTDNEGTQIREGAFGVVKGSDSPSLRRTSNGRTMMEGEERPLTQKVNKMVEWLETGYQKP